MSGVYAAMRALRGAKGDVIAALDGRTRFARAMGEEQHALIEHLGGEDRVSPTQRASIRSFLSLGLLIDRGMAFVIEQEGAIVNKRRRALYPVVAELADLLTRYHRVAKDLGYEPAPRPAKTLTQYLQEREAGRPDPAPAA